MQNKGTVMLDKSSIIVISGCLDYEAANETNILLSQMSRRINLFSQEKLIGFLLDCHNTDHLPVRTVIERMKALRKEGFSFYVLVKNAYSAATLIVAAADKDKRFIYKDGKMTFHNGNITLEAHEINGPGQISQAKYDAYHLAVIYYRKHLWGQYPEIPGFDMCTLDSMQIRIYTETSKLELTAEQCVSQLGFQNTAYVLTLD